jgi:hypothetical protein
MKPLTLIVTLVPFMAFIIAIPASGEYSKALWVVADFGALID